VACMLEANASLTPRRVRELLTAAAQPVPGAPVERQGAGAGAVDAGRAVTMALADRHSKRADHAGSPQLNASTVAFYLHDGRSGQVNVVGSWNDWGLPGLSAQELEPGLWRACLARPKGRHQYKFLLDGKVWLADPANPARVHDGRGAWNSLLVG
jgi:hypothetical protein